MKKIKYIFIVFVAFSICFLINNIPNYIVKTITKTMPQENIYEINSSDTDCTDYKNACLIAKSLKITKYYKIIITPYYIEFYEKGFLENVGGILKIIDPKITKDDIYSMKKILSEHEYFINDVGNGRYKRFTS